MLDRPGKGSGDAKLCQACTDLDALSSVRHAACYMDDGRESGIMRLERWAAIGIAKGREAMG